MKNCLRIAIATVVAFGASASLSAEVVPLFDATLITNSGLAVNIDNRWVFDEKTVTVYCAGGGTANVQTVGGGNPIVDNYMTAGDDSQSICAGGSPNLGGGPISGTNCFSSAGGIVEGNSVESAYTSTATAAIDLVDGENTVTVKLWDWGSWYGNSALELALPENCTTHTLVSMCAAQHMDIGVIDVINDAANLYVSFEIVEPGWYLAETHVAVGDDIPVTSKGNPIPGQFPYSCELNGSLQSECEVIIPLGELSGDVKIAAHAAAFQLAGDGCGSDLQYASEVITNNQGTAKDPLNYPNVPAVNRSVESSMFQGGEYPPGVAENLGFFSLGFGGDVTVKFGDGYPVYNAPGIDLCIQEITNGRAGYPLEVAELYGVNDTEIFIAEVTSRDTDTGYVCVDLPADVETVDFVKIDDNTDPTPHRDDADAYDVDFIAACYLYMGEETAWGAACYDGEGARFVDKGNWGTYFNYTIVD